MENQSVAMRLCSGDPIDDVKQNGPFIVAQLGQSLDGRISTLNGHSKYINHKDGLHHLHRLRSCVDGVVIGVGTLNDDDPLLTVRLCEGKSPLRVVIDPNGRAFSKAKLFHDSGPRTIILTRQDVTHPMQQQNEIIHLPHNHGRISPDLIIKVLAERGLSRLLIEGGARTVSTFLDHKLIDRLQLIVSPLILGSGQPGLTLSSIKSVQEGLKPSVRFYPLGHDVLYSCDFRA